MIRIVVCDNDTKALEDVHAQIGKLMAENNVPCEVSCFTNGQALVKELRDLKKQTSSCWKVYWRECRA